MWQLKLDIRRLFHFKILKVRLYLNVFFCFFQLLNVLHDCFKRGPAWVLEVSRVARHSYQDMDGTVVGLQEGKASKLVTAVQHYT